MLISLLRDRGILASLHKRCNSLYIFLFIRNSADTLIFSIIITFIIASDIYPSLQCQNCRLVLGTVQSINHPFNSSFYVPIGAALLSSEIENKVIYIKIGGYINHLNPLQKSAGVFGNHSEICFPDTGKK